MRQIGQTADIQPGIFRAVVVRTGRTGQAKIACVRGHREIVVA